MIKQYFFTVHALNILKVDFQLEKSVWTVIASNLKKEIYLD